MESTETDSSISSVDQDYIDPRGRTFRSRKLYNLRSNIRLVSETPKKRKRSDISGSETSTETDVSEYIGSDISDTVNKQTTNQNNIQAKLYNLRSNVRLCSKL